MFTFGWSYGYACCWIALCLCCVGSCSYCSGGGLSVLYCSYVCFYVSDRRLWVASNVDCFAVVFFVNPNGSGSLNPEGMLVTNVLNSSLDLGSNTSETGSVVLLWLILWCFRHMLKSAGLKSLGLPLNRFVLFSISVPVIDLGVFGSKELLCPLRCSGGWWYVDLIPCWRSIHSPTLKPFRFLRMFTSHLFL